MEPTFYFYDLETSGVDPRKSRIMQFAGQRCGLDLDPIGQPDNILIKLHEDVLPDPDAILVTGITPQMTLSEGVTEAEFFKYFFSSISTPNTIFVGFNNIRFDDELIRFGLFRNYYDPYEWQWKDGRGKWDILDVARATRALRPNGINWPMTADNKPTNKLELISKLNGLEHNNAHDALSDVMATIEVAKIIKKHQPRLFHYLFNLRDKKAIEKFVNDNPIFVYISGRFDNEFEKTAVVTSIGSSRDKSGVFVYDLRYDPSKYINLSVDQLVELIRFKKSKEEVRLPVKPMQFNKCPALSQLSGLRPEDQTRLRIDLSECHFHQKIIEDNPDFNKKVIKAFEVLRSDFNQTQIITDINTPESALYESFISPQDRKVSTQIISSQPNEIMNYQEQLRDKRLQAILPLYKARNFPKSLTTYEIEKWEKYKQSKIGNQIDGYVQRIGELLDGKSLTTHQKYLLDELNLYLQSLLSFDS